MLRSSILTAGAIAFAVSAAAQTTSPTLKVSRDVHRVQGPVKHAGVYHVATGTWTRSRGNQANVGPDIVYNNSLGTGYYSNIATGTLAGLTWLDTGNVPTVVSNGSFATAPDRTKYTVNCFEYGYCDFDTVPASSSWGFTFYDSAAPCVNPIATPLASMTFANLPSTGCWNVTFDLTGVEFCLEGDGGALAPGWDLDDPILDSFGFGIDFLGTPTNAGPLLSGDPDNDDNGYNALNPNGSAACNPANCPAAPAPNGGNATYFNPPGLCNLPLPATSIGTFRATGRLTRDFWLATDNDPNTSGAPEGCYYFGGYFNTTGCNTATNNPYSAPFMIIAAAAGECVPSGGSPINGGVGYCASNPNSTGQTTALDIQGNLDPTLNDCTLTANNMPLNSFGFFITSQNAGFTANPAGSRGNICLGANIGRFVGAGQIKNSAATGTVSLSTTAPVEWNLNAVPQATGPYAAMAGIRSHFQLWHRDTFMGSATSNFSDGKYVDWQ